MSSPETNFSNLSEVDRLVHEPARLAVMASLYVVASADYAFLMSQVGLSWGNLSAHLSKLEDAGYIEITKSFRGKRPYTLVRLSVAGREVLKKYVAQMNNILAHLDDK